jgi:hypothetical protein
MRSRTTPRRRLDRLPVILERDAGRKITVATRPLPKSSPASVVEVQAEAGDRQERRSIEYMRSDQISAPTTEPVTPTRSDNVP